MSWVQHRRYVRFSRLRGFATLARLMGQGCTGTSRRHALITGRFCLRASAMPVLLTVRSGVRSRRR